MKCAFVHKRGGNSAFVYKRGGNNEVCFVHERGGELPGFKWGTLRWCPVHKYGVLGLWRWWIMKCEVCMQSGT